MVKYHDMVGYPNDNDVLDNIAVQQKQNYQTNDESEFYMEINK